MEVHSDTKMLDILAVHLRLFVMALIATFFVSYTSTFVLRSFGADPGFTWFVTIWPSYFCGKKAWEFFDK